METKTHQQLAMDYGVSRSTLYRRLQKAKIKLSGSGLIKPLELEKIYAKLGKPKKEHRQLAQITPDWNNLPQIVSFPSLIFVGAKNTKILPHSYTKENQDYFMKLFSLPYKHDYHGSKNSTRLSQSLRHW